MKNYHLLRSVVLLSVTLISNVAIAGYISNSDEGCGGVMINTGAGQQSWGLDLIKHRDDGTCINLGPDNRIRVNADTLPPSTTITNSFFPGTNILDTVLVSERNPLPAPQNLGPDPDLLNDMNIAKKLQELNLMRHSAYQGNIYRAGGYASPAPIISIPQILMLPSSDPALQRERAYELNQQKEQMKSLNGYR